MTNNRLPPLLQSLILAFQFLTRIPMPDIGIAPPAIAGRSLLFYPVVGLAIGSALYLLQMLLEMIWPQQWGLQAALLLAVWCLFSGGLHLDGLADSADAWVGGMGDRQRTLELMKDPRCGPAAVMILALLLLCKFAALEAVVRTPELLVIAPVAGRSLLLLLFLTTDYVRPQGLGALLLEQMPKKACQIVLLCVCLLVVPLGGLGFWVVISSLIAFFGLRALMNQRLGGTTGDTAGAMVEITELSVLLAVAVYS